MLDLMLEESVNKMPLSIARVIGGVYSGLGLLILIVASVLLSERSPYNVDFKDLISVLLPAYFLISVGLLALIRTKNTLIIATKINFLASPITLLVSFINRGYETPTEVAIVLLLVFLGLPILALTILVNRLMLKEKRELDFQEPLPTSQSILTLLVTSVLIIIATIVFSFLSIDTVMDAMAQKAQYAESKKLAKISTIEGNIVLDASTSKCPEIKKLLRFTLLLYAPNDKQSFTVDLRKVYVNSRIKIIPERIYLDGILQKVEGSEFSPTNIIVTEGNHEIYFDVKLCPESRYDYEDRFNISMYYGLGLFPEGKNDLIKIDYETRQYNLNDFK